jgi:uncharacterized protein
MKRMLHVLLIAVAGYIALVGLLYLMQSSMIFIPDRNVSADPGVIGLQWMNVRFETEDGKRLHGWYIPNETSRYVLLFSHGNAGNISHRLGFLERLYERGFSTFIYDYRGYGNSEGRPSEKGIHKDIDAAWNYLIHELEYNADEIILFGRSLGGPFSAKLASVKNPGGLILESTFTSAKDVATDLYPFIPPSIVRFQLDTISQLQRITVPVLVMHSRDDEIIPYHHGQALFEAAQEPKYFSELRGGHNDNYIASGEFYFNELRRFLVELEE